MNLSEFSGSLTAKVESFNLDAIPKPDTLYIMLDNVDELRRQHGGIRWVVLRRGDEEHRYDVDQLIGLLMKIEEHAQKGGSRSGCERSTARPCTAPAASAGTPATEARGGDGE